MKSQTFLSASMLFILFAFVSGFKANPTKTETKGKIMVAAPAEEKEMSFAEFLSHFEKTALPFSVTLEELNRKKIKPSKTQLVKSSKLEKPRKRATIKRGPLHGSKFIPELAYGGFSRIGPPQIEPIARFFPNDKMVAVVYKSFYGYSDNWKSYNLVIYDTKGNIVFPEKEKNGMVYSGFNIGSFSTNNTVTCQIDETGHLWKNTFKNVYDKGVKEHEYYKNEVVSYNLEDTQIWKIDNNGAVVKLTEYPDVTLACLD